MADSALGYLLRELRAERGLNLRELGQLADVDHAYIQRLETGTKTSPSEEVLGRLARALKAPKREAEMLAFLARHSETPVWVAEGVRSDPTASFLEFRGLATMAHRGSGRPDYATSLRRLRSLWSEDE